MMSGNEWVQVVTLICTAITATVGSLVGAYLAYVTAKLKLKQDDAASKIDKIETNTNSLTSRLEEAARRVGEATGVDKERARALAANALIALGILQEKETHRNEAADIAEDVGVVKDDVKIVKSDVADVHATVVEGVRTGVQRGIERGIEESKEN